MYRYYVIVLMLLFQLSLKAQDQFSKISESIDLRLQQLIDTTGAAPVVNILCEFGDVKSGFEYQGAFGYVDLRSALPATTSHTFKVASITKMFTAVAVLQLAEKGIVDLDDPIAGYLGDLEFVKIDSLHQFNGRSFGREITVRQLLGHRSGLADLFTDKEAEFFGVIMDDPQHQWSAEDLFALYYRMQLPKAAKFAPGEGYAYSDTGYFLLGLLVEAKTGRSLPEVFREKILDPLEMKQTYFEYYEANPGVNPQVHAFVGAIDATAMINTSFDWAGGGLVSTTTDLSLFMQGLFSGKLFRKAATLEEMCGDADYGLGIGRFQLNDTMYYGHTGYWGSGVFYHPDSGRTLCLSVNQTEAGFSMRELLEELLLLFP